MDIEHSMLSSTCGDSYHLKYLGKSNDRTGQDRNGLVVIMQSEKSATASRISMKKTSKIGNLDLAAGGECRYLSASLDESNLVMRLATNNQMKFTGKN